MKRLPIVVLALAILSVSCVPGVSAQDDETQGNRKVTTKIVPTYPQLARVMNLKGTVRLTALVLPSGKVKSIEVKGGNALLVQSAENAVREWKWEKTEHETTELIQVNFNPK